MAQANVAREPSMDEILASIRKIIESNEPGMPTFPANDAGFARSAYSGDDDYDEDADDIHLTIDDDVAGFRQEPEIRSREIEPEHAAPRFEPPKPAMQSTPPLSLADVAARVRAASERHSAPMHREPEAAVPTPVRNNDGLPASRLNASAPDRDPPARAASYPHASDASSYPSVAAVKPEPITDLSRSDAVAQVAPAPVPVAAAARPEPSIVDADVAAIVSPAVGQQVARSFEDLALAVDSGPRRSFDDIAQDMLRPMLQEWLDDNLPTLVERLVREEIERVARGPRR